MAILILFVSTWIGVCGIQISSCWHAFQQVELMKSERQYWSTIISTVLSAFSIVTLVLMCLALLGGKFGFGIAYWIFAGRTWLHTGFIANNGLQLVLMLYPPFSPRMPSAYLGRAMAFCSSCAASFAVIMGFQFR